MDFWVGGALVSTTMQASKRPECHRQKLPSLFESRAACDWRRRAVHKLINCAVLCEDGRWLYSYPIRRCLPFCASSYSNDRQAGKSLDNQGGCGVVRSVKDLINRKGSARRLSGYQSDSESGTRGVNKTTIERDLRIPSYVRVTISIR
jgi:hypothetical protein